MKKDKPYQPISCNFYDLLEAAATRRAPVAIKYQNDSGELQTTTAIIKDLQAKEGEEFIYLDNGISFRLDRLVSVDGEELKGYC